tara:strand:- start:2509 stop:3429 length:921 start_codon:yes stop_codon:yes gene_type:complete
MRAFAVATGNMGYVEALEASCVQAGIQLKFLGMGERWRGFVWANSLIREELAKMLVEYSDELVLMLDGYDTLVCSHANDLADAHHEACKTDGRDPQTTVVVAPEHHTQWCSPMFDAVYHRAGKKLFHVDINAPYVLNAGVRLGSARALLTLIDRIVVESEKTGITDDQRLLNELFWSSEIFKSVNVTVDIVGAVAYCHANRTFLSFTLWQTISHNRHHIHHESHFTFEKKSLHLKRNGRRVGVVHGIANADIDQLVQHIVPDAPLPTRRKPITQLSWRVSIVLAKFVVLLIMFAAAINLQRSTGGS